ncbi:MAG: LLM class flavin-dependent oxidoreductase [Burkholderiales bacterium]|nr:LLM class flavin-dependent oxidoreductase [Anaerolineae bacterium]
MLEGQAGLTWERWQRLLNAAEEYGFQCMFRSDHFTIGPPDEESLETYVSLTFAASHTKNIEFSPCVSPTTFRNPALTVRMAAAICDLSGGRMLLGLGAGWHEREHKQFGIPFYDKATRFEMLTDALEITKRLRDSDTPVSYQGKHYSLEDAILLERPKHYLRILIGGNGPKKTLPLAAQFADEWNGVFIDPAGYAERSALLDGYLQERGRKSSDVKRSLMTQIIIGKDDADLQRRLTHFGVDPSNMEESAKRIIGTPSAVVEKINEYAEAGVQRFALQWLQLDDMDGIELIARDVLPHFHK